MWAMAISRQGRSQSQDRRNNSQCFGFVRRTAVVQSNTRLQVFRPLLMHVPSRGGVDIGDNRVFTVINNGRTGDLRV